MRETRRTRNTQKPPNHPSRSPEPSGGQIHRIDLPPLPDVRSGGVLGTPDWLRTTVVVGGVEHYLDFVVVHEDERGVQHAATKDLDAMLRLHRLACGGEGPFASIEIEEHRYVLFFTPSCI